MGLLYVFSFSQRNFSRSNNSFSVSNFFLFYLQAAFCCLSNHFNFHMLFFINATLDKASEENERLKLTIKSKANLIHVTQIAGLIARRIICNVKLKDNTNQGDRYGIIKFGSRVDIEFPDNFDLLVSVGQQCIGGETIIAQENKTSKIKSKRDFKKI